MVAKYNVVSRNCAWVCTIGTPSNDILHDVQIDSTGRLYVAIDSTGEPPMNFSGSQAIQLDPPFVIAINQAGTSHS